MTSVVKPIELCPYVVMRELDAGFIRDSYLYCNLVRSEAFSRDPELCTSNYINCRLYKEFVKKTEKF